MVRWIVAFLLIMLAGLGRAAPDVLELRFSTADGMRYNTEALDLLRKAYDALGIQFSVTYLTPARSIQEVESGFMDGELVRIKQLGDHFTDIVRVDVPIISLKIFAYTGNEALTGLTLKEMDGFQVGHVSGAVFAHNMTANLPNAVRVETPDVLFKMLQRGRLDIAIAPEMTGDHFRQEAVSGTVFKGTIPLGTLDFYHYLNRRHIALVEPLEQTLNAILQAKESTEPYVHQ